jgi:ferredoxin
MALKITNECVICHACLPECPNNAIYEPADEWTFAEGTQLKEIELESGEIMSAYKKMEAVSKEFYYIVPEKCTECKGFHEEPQCAAVCPVDCCVPDPDQAEDIETLQAKKIWMHGDLRL